MVKKMPSPSEIEGFHSDQKPDTSDDPTTSKSIAEYLREIRAQSALIKTNGARWRDQLVLASALGRIRVDY